MPEFAEQFKDFANTWLYDPVIGKLISICVGAIIIFSFGRLIKRLLSRYVNEGTTRYQLKKAVSFLGYLLLGLYIASIVGGNFKQLSVIFGVAGAGIAFSLQEVIASIAGWIAISFGNFFKIGHRVQLGGIIGDVIDIGVFRTTLMECGEWVKGDLYNGRIVRVANSFVFKSPVFNYSGDFPFLWDEITLPIRYGSDYKMARSIIEKALQETVGQYTAEVEQKWKSMVGKYMIENARLEPMVSVECNDNWVQFTGRYVVGYKNRRATKDLIFTRILNDVEASSNKVRFASATFELVDAPTFSIKNN